MATRVREQFFSPLSTEEARAVVKEIDAHLDQLCETQEASEPFPTPDGFHLVSEDGERDEDNYAALDVLDDFSLTVEEPRPPKQATSCRSTLALEYYARIFDKPLFIAVQKLLFARLGAAFVACDDDGKLMKLATFVAGREKMVGPRWASTLALGRRAPFKKPRKTRPAKPGELEAVTLFKRLARVIDGNDPFVRAALRRELEGSTEPVRAYAAALMEQGPRSDVLIAKQIASTATNVAAARTALTNLLKKVSART